MLQLIISAWRTLRRRCAFRAAQCVADPCPGEGARVLQLVLLRRLSLCGERWVGVKELDVDGAAPPLLDALEQLADHHFVKILVNRPGNDRAVVLAARLLPKGRAFVAAYAAHAPASRQHDPCAGISDARSTP